MKKEKIEKFERAIALQERLIRGLSQFSDYKGDSLSYYRGWLDKKGIESEGADGFPNENAYDENNIIKFIKEESFATI
jgi:hypothetical protein